MREEIAQRELLADLGEAETRIQELEAILHESQGLPWGFFRRINQQMPLPVYVADRVQRLRFANDRLLEFLEAGPAIQGQFIGELFPHEMAAQLEKSNERVLETGMAMEFEMDIAWRGEDRTMLLTKSFYHDPVLEEDFVVCLAQDITLRKVAERELAASAERHRRIIETTGEGFILTDLDLIIVDCNTALTRQLRRCRRDILGHKPIEFVDDETAVFLREHKQEILQAKNRIYEATFVRGNGSTFPALVHSNTFTDDGGSPIGYMAFLADLTEQKEAERLHEDVERIVRHDMKSQVMALFSLPYLLRRTGLTDDQAELVDLVESSGYQLLEMVNRSLDLYKMEKGAYQLTPKDVNLVSVVQRVAQNLAELAESRNARVRVFIDDEEANEQEQFLVRGEELLFYSMLANLIKNGLEAIPKESEQTDGKPEVAVELTEKPDGSALITVRNPGAVPPAMRECFFEKYRTCGKPDGTGLGAYSVLLIAQTHGGDASMQTWDDENATAVTVRIPAEPPGE